MSMSACPQVKGHSVELKTAGFLLVAAHFLPPAAPFNRQTSVSSWWYKRAPCRRRLLLLHMETTLQSYVNCTRHVTQALVTYLKTCAEIQLNPALTSAAFLLDSGLRWFKTPPRAGRAQHLHLIFTAYKDKIQENQLWAKIKKKEKKKQCSLTCESYLKQTLWAAVNQ